MEEKMKKELNEFTNEELVHEILERMRSAEVDKNLAEPDVVIDTDEEEPEPTEQQGHVIKCSDCGKADTVPFKPKNDWPVRCRNCYKTRNR